MRKRGADEEAVIQKRLAVARQEAAQWKNFDYLLISGDKRGGFAPGAGDHGGGKNAALRLLLAALEPRNPGSLLNQ